MPNANRSTDRAPEELTFPETLRITITSGEEAFDQTVAAADAAETGEQPPAVISFESATGFRRLLTDRRLDLIRSLMGESAPSITALAERLDRSYSVVHDDIAVLAEYGIVYFQQDGQSKQPFIPYEMIEFDVTVQAPATGCDTETPA